MNNLAYEIDKLIDLNDIDARTVFEVEQYMLDAFQWSIAYPKHRAVDTFYIDNLPHTLIIDTSAANSMPAYKIDNFYSHFLTLEETVYVILSFLKS